MDSEAPKILPRGFATYIFHLLDFAQASLAHLQMKNAPTFVEALTLVFRGEGGVIRFAHDPLISGSQNQIIRCAGFIFFQAPESKLSGLSRKQKVPPRRDMI